MSKRDFYSRQTILKDVGPSGQIKLENTKAVIVGAGGLGHPVGQYLAAAGVGEITILDFDLIEESNMNRQVCFNKTEVGRPKARVLKEKLSGQNPYIKILSRLEKIDANNVVDILKEADIIFDCCDNFKTKFLLHDTAFFLKKDLVQASLYQYEGQVQVFNYSKENTKGCLRCLWPKVPKANCTGTCQEAGLIGAVAGSLGTLQAMAGIKLILGLGSSLQNTTTTVDLLSFETNKIRWNQAPRCPLCSEHASIKEIQDKNYEERESFELDEIPAKEFTLIDIREFEELEKEVSVPSLHRPLSEYKNWVNLLDKDENYLFVCSKGIRSSKLVKELMTQEFKNCYSLRKGLGGLEEFRSKS
tara:strand:- start:24292 stop:25368 length:1077 start_codon:yes stop_codon:yes gene_type:complete